MTLLVGNSTDPGTSVQPNFGANGFTLAAGYTAVASGTATHFVIKINSSGSSSGFRGAVYNSSGTRIAVVDYTTDVTAGTKNYALLSSVVITSGQTYYLAYWFDSADTQIAGGSAMQSAPVSRPSGQPLADPISPPLSATEAIGAVLVYLDGTVVTAAALEGAATAGAIATGDLTTTPATKGLSLTTGQPSLSALRWAWFDSTDPSTWSAPAVMGSGESTDGSGVLTIDLTGTSLAVGGWGYLVINKEGAVQEDDVVFAGRLQVETI